MANSGAKKESEAHTRLESEIQEVRQSIEEIKQELRAIRMSKSTAGGELGTELGEAPSSILRALSTESRSILNQLTPLGKSLTMQELYVGLGATGTLGRVSNLLTNLEKKGYVWREKGNGGIYNWYITKEGLQALQTAESAKKEYLSPTAVRR